MYNDYPTANYTSNVDQFIFLKIGLIVLAIGIFVVFLISYMKVFRKGNRNGVSALIPFYNIIPLLEICNLPKMYFLFLIIPGVNLIFYYKVAQVLAAQFKKNNMFGLGLFILPFIYYPILGFGKSEYIGINLVDMDSRNQVSRIDIIDENKNKEIEVEENVDEDVATRNINISLGGGKYQKDYATNLDQVEGEQVIAQRNLKQKKKELEEQKMEDQKFIYQTHQMSELRNESQEGDTTSEKIDEVFDINYIKTTNEVNTNNNLDTIVSKPVEEEKPKIEHVKCPKCGTNLPKGTEFCITCGTKL